MEDVPKRRSARTVRAAFSGPAFEGPRATVHSGEQCLPFQMIKRILGALPAADLARSRILGSAWRYATHDDCLWKPHVRALGGSFTAAHGGRAEDAYLLQSGASIRWAHCWDMLPLPRLRPEGSRLGMVPIYGPRNKPNSDLSRQGVLCVMGHLLAMHSTNVTQVEIWDLSQFTRLGILTGQHTKSVRCAWLGAPHLATAGEDGLVQLWDAVTYVPTVRIAQPSMRTPVQVHVDAARLTVAWYGKGLITYHPHNGQLIHFMRCEIYRSVLAIHHDRAAVLTGCTNGTACVFDLTTGVMLWTSKNTDLVSSVFWRGPDLMVAGLRRIDGRLPVMHRAKSCPFSERKRPFNDIWGRNIDLGLPLHTVHVAPTANQTLHASNIYSLTDNLMISSDRNSAPVLWHHAHGCWTPTRELTAVMTAAEPPTTSFMYLASVFNDRIVLIYNTCRIYILRFEPSYRAAAI